MNYSYNKKKIVAVLLDNIETGVALNVIGHLSISIGAYANNQELMGCPLINDLTGIKHLGISKYPFIITKTKKGKLRKAINAAKSKPTILVADYPKEMLITEHDDDLVNSIAKIKETELEYLGAVLYGSSEDIDQITGKFSLWK